VTTHPAKTALMEIEIRCSCGGAHVVPLDASGHYAGPLPCDPTRRVELQIEPQLWRSMVEQEQANKRH